jgi:hypothetical protein
VADSSPTRLPDLFHAVLAGVVQCEYFEWSNCVLNGKTFDKFSSEFVALTDRRASGIRHERTSAGRRLAQSE